MGNGNNGNKHEELEKVISVHIGNFKSTLNCICSIKKLDKFNNGFFCKIPFPDNLHNLPVIIILNMFLTEEDLMPGKNLYLTYGENSKNIYIDTNRKIFFSKEYNISIIEIKDTDNINQDCFQEIDENIFNEKLDTIYLNKSIIILYKSKEEELKFSMGYIYEINPQNYSFMNNSGTHSGGAGAAIFNAKKNKIIGIQCEILKNDIKGNYAIFLKSPIEKFYENKKKKIETLNKVYEKEINNLKNELDKVKKENINLNEKIKCLEKLLENEKKININSNMNIKGLINMNNNSNPYLTKILELKEKLESKDNEIKEIISRYPVELLKGEKLMSIIFVSLDQKIHYSIICKNTDQFIKIESKLYKEYPQYMNSENFFMANGNKINRFISLEENGIKDSDIITLKKFDIYS